MGGCVALRRLTLQTTGPGGLEEGPGEAPIEGQALPVPQHHMMQDSGVTGSLV